MPAAPSISSAVVGAALVVAGIFSPAPWAKLEVGAEAALARELNFAGTVVPSDTLYRVEEITPLEMIDVTEFLLRQEPCRRPEMERPMILVLPPGSPAGSEVGVELRQGCVLAVYAETRDLFQPSLFR